MDLHPKQAGACMLPTDFSYPILQYPKCCWEGPTVLFIAPFV
jgi:hypothetical protein